MNQLSEKATSAFQKLGQEVGATVVINETGPNFESLQYWPTHEVYLFDRKHGIEKLNEPSGFPNLGWAILQASSKMENTRFSCVAIQNTVEKTLDVYQATMLDVKQWRYDIDSALFNEEVDRANTATSSAGLSSSL